MSVPRSGEDLPGRRSSPWLDGAERPARPPLRGDRRADVVVAGAGIVGLTAAVLCRRAGADVVVLEGGRIGQGVTGNTTAKLSSLHGLKYASLRGSHGEGKARIYAEANEAGIAAVASLVEELGVDCGLRRAAAYTYTLDPDRVDDVEAEVEAAIAAGLPAAFTTRTDLPFEVAGAVTVDDQAEFDPVPYLVALAGLLDADGPRVFERSRVVGVDGGKVRTEDGATVEAGHTILATQMPVLDRGGQFALVEPSRSYALGMRIGASPPRGMYLSADSPTRSLRSHPLGGEELLIVGGESHSLGHGDAASRFRTLESWARRTFDVTSIEHRWAAHDFLPLDGLPLVGRVWPFSERVLGATGMGKWGLAMGTSAAAILADAVAGEENPWASAFDPRRLPRLGALPRFARHNADSGLHFVVDRLRRRGAAADGMAPGEGRIVDSGLGKTALYRDEDGVLHALSARCTHLGCLVRWNGAERTWDCPCHGSRFEPTGEVLTGPATGRLAAKSPPG